MHPAPFRKDEEDIADGRQADSNGNSSGQAKSVIDFEPLFRSEAQEKPLGRALKRDERAPQQQADRAARQAQIDAARRKRAERQEELARRAREREARVAQREAERAARQAQIDAARRKHAERQEQLARRARERDERAARRLKLEEQRREKERSEPVAAQLDRAEHLKVKRRKEDIIRFLESAASHEDILSLVEMAGMLKAKWPNMGEAGQWNAELSERYNVATDTFWKRVDALQGAKAGALCCG